MRVYVVKEGDDPRSIAKEKAGCPKCQVDLVRANTHRESVTYANGYRTFKEPLVPGERLWIPDRWTDEILDALPKSYFEDLPDMPFGLGQAPVEDSGAPSSAHVLYVVQPGEDASAIAAKYGAKDAKDLVEANPDRGWTTGKYGQKGFCSLQEGDIISLPDVYFAPGSPWASTSVCTMPSTDTIVSPRAAQVYADLHHPAAKDVQLDVSAAAVEKMHSASGGEGNGLAAKGAAAGSTLLGAGVVVSFVSRVLSSVATRQVSGYLEDSL